MFLSRLNLTPGTSVMGVLSTCVIFVGVPHAQVRNSLPPPVSASAHLVAAPQPVTDRAGQLWAPDTTAAVGGKFSTTSHAIGGTTEPKLYQSQRYGMTGYRIPLAAATYTVTLNLAEHYWRDAKRRVFTVTAEGRSVAGNVDVVAKVGEFHAYQLRFTVAVNDGTLDLGFGRLIDLPMVSSLSAVRAAAIPGQPAGGDPSSSAPTSSAPTTSGAGQPPAAVKPESFGARGDGRSDDTAALQNAFDSAPAGVPVYLTAGRTYAHSGLLHLRRAGLHVTGGAVLLATDQSRSSVWIEADNVLVDGGLTIKVASTTQRWSAWEQMGVRVVGHQGVVLRDVVIDGSAAAGLYVGNQASLFVLDHLKVMNTRADGIHLTMGAHDGQVIAPTVINTGDDGVAVVSYAADGAACHDITVVSPHVLGTTGGRGLSVVGGTRIIETDIDVQRTSAAGVYIASEGYPWYTTAAQDVTISGGSIVGANTDATVDHGAVLVMSGQLGVSPTAVSIRGLNISLTRVTSSRDIGVITYGTAPRSILFADLVIQGGPKSAYQGNTPQTSYQLRNLVQNGSRLPDRG